MVAQPLPELHCPYCAAAISGEGMHCAACGRRLGSGVWRAASMAANPSELKAQGFPAPPPPLPQKGPPPAAPLPGQLIEGRYRVLARVGKGGMGEVYRVVHDRMNRVMALKILAPDKSLRPQLRERFRREIKAVSMLSNPHTVTVFDCGETADGTLYLVMEYLHGMSLAQLLGAHGTVSAADTAAIGAQVCEALAEAHQAGIIHRDIKPENIYLLPAETGYFVKVLDFGLAKLAGADPDPSGLSVPGMVVGTPHYMAPEMAKGLQIDERVDIYALGCTMYESLAGRPPFDGETPVEVMVAQVKQAVPQPAELNPSVRVPPALWAIIERTLRKNPDERYRSVTGLRHDLAKFIESTASTPGKALVSSPVLSGSAPPVYEGGLLPAGRDDWDAFERGLKRRQSTTRWGSLAALGALLAAAVWGSRTLQENPLSGQEHEPNDAPEIANLLHLPGEISGFLGPPAKAGKGDEDYFRFALERGPAQILEITLVPVPSVVQEAAVFRDGKLIKRGGGFAGTILFPNLAAEPGIYHILVREAVAPGATPVVDTATPYALAVVTRPREPGGETEPNDSHAEAHYAAKTTQITGLIADPGDEDFFRFDAPPRTFKVELMAEGGVAGFDLRILTSVGALYSSHVKPGRSGGIAAPKLHVDAVGSPFYAVVRAKDTQPGVVRAYTLTVHP